MSTPTATGRIAREATERSPHVDFDLDRRRLLLEGESYPEDAAAFFGPLVASLRRLVAELDGEAMTMELHLVYFNSSTAKALMNMFLLLEEAARQGNEVVIKWHYHSDDEAMEEFGQEFAEDFEHVAFQLCRID